MYAAQYRTGAPCATPCARPPTMVAACPKPDPCAVPQHTETYQIPHHRYKLNSQTITRRWLEHTVEMREMPATQELLVGAQPPIDVCVSAPKPCPPAPCPPRASYGYRY